MKTHISDLLISHGVKNIVIMPDSLTKNFLEDLYASQGNLEIYQCLNETEALTISYGLNLAGALSITVIENSGLRSVGDILARFELSHHIHNIFMVSMRGQIGEENWWGVMHERVTQSIIKDLGMLEITINNYYRFRKMIGSCISTFLTDQSSIVIKMMPEFLRSI